MVKPEWGLKRVCPKCGASFYDMRKKEFSCPKCATQFDGTSFEEMKAKQLAKLAKKNTARPEDADVDEETLLQMTEDVPLGEEMIGKDGLDILEDTEDMDSDHSDMSDIVYDDDELKSDDDR